MTTRSTASASSAVPREDQDVYLATLRIAILEYNLTRAGHDAPSPAPAGTSSSAPNGHSTTSAATLTRPPIQQSITSTSRTGDGWTSALHALGDVFKDSSSSSNKSSRFPEQFIKVLDQRMERIARGSDPAHSDPLFRATVGAFYTTYAQPSFKKKLKENRQIEEVILMFVTTASSILKKRLQGDEWKGELNSQVGRFVGVIRDALKSCSRVPGELVNRLEAYCSKLVEPAPQSYGHARTPSAAAYPTHSPKLSSGYSPSTASTSRNTLDGPPPPSSAPVKLEDMPQVLAVGSIFGKTDAELMRDVTALRRRCSEQAAFNDLKLIINTVAQLGSAPSSSAPAPRPTSRFPFSRTDFDSDEAFAAWRKQENDELQQLLLDMTVRNPELVKNYTASVAASNGSLGVDSAAALDDSRRSSRSSLVIVNADGGIEGEDGDGNPGVFGFTFVPPDPKFYYRRLYSLALEHDYALMSTLPPDQDVSLSILSPQHEDLLRACQTRWRIPNTLRAAQFAGLIAELYKEQGVPEECVGEALETVRREEAMWRYPRWPVDDRKHLFRSLSLLFDTLLARFFDIFQGLLPLPFSAVVPPLHEIYLDELFAASIGALLPATLSELETGLRKFVAMAWEEKMADVDSRERASDLEPWIGMLVWIKEEVKGYDGAFPEKVCNQIDPPALFISVSAPLFVQHLDRSRIALLAAASQQEGAASDAELLDLYHGVKELKAMHEAFCPEEPLVIDFSAWFEPYVRRWLAMTDTQTSEWVNRAIGKDKFEPEETATHSSSIVDLIESCKAPVDFVLKLNWPNEYENAKFLTGLSRTIAKSIEQYANQLEGMFIEEMFPRKADEALNQDVARPSAWLTKAKLAVQGDKKVEAFEFQAASCIKLNNIQAARRLLDTMYGTLDADKVSRIVEINTPPTQPDANAAPPTYLFTVKIVLCENLSPPSGNSRSKKLDPFLILSDPAGYRVAKTRTLYETNDPRWDETLDVSVKGDLWLRATVYNRNLVDHHDNVGCAYIHLDPRKFSDFLSQDVWFRLEDQNRQPLEGRLLLRISMEGEKDDIQFYFGRAFRSLKRAEGDMVRMMVDKMSPFVRHYISQQNLRSLLKLGTYNLPDLDKVRGNLDKGVNRLNLFVRDALAASTNSSTSTLLIPPVADPNAPTAVTLERLEQKKKGKGPLTDLEIENAIGDLLDYFEVTFATLKESLTPDAWQLVINRLWKEILTTIEGLLVPPLSDRPTEMRPLSEKEVDVVYKWLGFLVNFFHGGGEGVPLEELRNSKYLELIEARMYYEWSPDDLMRASVESMQRQLTARSDSLLGRSKSVYQQRNLGTIRAHKIEKKQQVTSSGEMILRILRMHPGTSDFLSTQLATIQRLQAEQMRKQQLKSQRGSLQRGSGAEGGGRRRLAAAGGGQRLSTIQD